MGELLFFIIGLVIGGLTMTVVMCFLQVNRINDLEGEIFLLQNRLSEVYYED